MTLKERVGMESPKCVSKYFVGGVMGCPEDYDFLKPVSPGCDHRFGSVTNKQCVDCWNREMEKNETPRIVAYDENFLYLNNGKKIAPPSGYKFNPDDIKKILEVEE